MAPDIEQTVSRNFAPAEYQKAIEILRLVEHDLNSTAADRILRCVVFLADGEMTKLDHYADRAIQDSRDVMYWAEYDKNNQQVRDFQEPFPN